MDRPLNGRITVAGQISPDQLPAIKASGHNVLVDSRPDQEVGDDLQSERMRIAAEAAGLTFHYIPMTPGQMPEPSAVADFLAALQGGKVFAYCGGGPRAIVLASFAAAQEGKPIEEILDDARSAGIDLSPARQQLIERGASEG
ncbi:TIGR01244 family phosphatase [Parvularcula sp. ZS-1/3]|uniref:TIGR01244 family phosphatase n=1 Tax=Parvularcula mediterranea TaxID=2732508 RepID=A0A7Y3RJI1_9PROT|nr:sulfur transferase domain-containing protein [Parvularcula mediterranea]NNU15213.1 TIGR01244 family phosphatase [Parvularcula mediterranea]